MSSLSDDAFGSSGATAMPSMAPVVSTGGRASSGRPAGGGILDGIVQFEEYFQAPTAPPAAPPAATPTEAVVSSVYRDDDMFAGMDGGGRAVSPPLPPLQHSKHDGSYDVGVVSAISVTETAPDDDVVMGGTVLPWPRDVDGAGAAEVSPPRGGSWHDDYDVFAGLAAASTAEVTAPRVVSRLRGAWQQPLSHLDAPSLSEPETHVHSTGGGHGGDAGGGDGSSAVLTPTRSSTQAVARSPDGWTDALLFGEAEKDWGELPATEVVLTGYAQAGAAEARVMQPRCESSGGDSAASPAMTSTDDDDGRSASRPPSVNLLGAWMDGEPLAAVAGGAAATTAAAKKPPRRKKGRR
jgi:hypothetical protein